MHGTPCKLERMLPSMAGYSAVTLKVLAFLQGCLSLIVIVQSFLVQQRNCLLQTIYIASSTLTIISLQTSVLKLVLNGKIFNVTSGLHTVLFPLRSLIDFGAVYCYNTQLARTI